MDHARHHWSDRRNRDLDGLRSRYVYLITGGFMVVVRRSAGIMLYQVDQNDLKVLLVHPGGPFWAHRDLGAWSIPKGEYDGAEPPEEAARREFEEELGTPYLGSLLDLGELRQNSGKRVTAYAGNGPFDIAGVRSNVFEMEWPPHSRKRQSFPEVDRAEWFSADEARRRIIPAQTVFIDRLLARLDLASSKG
ncbi:NUDIX domain-containing protein [Asticcacaulis sp. 201]|uniref:NUDIX domain-containing protein n=1 Tax=Asticcacaulis sp. 201 TaxID=3028787 RepID=UPI0029163E8F|nr:NUDIX domain-containing protein [Asticcacaulis sp. 201]MDV6331168.1 NUDIX domain-containing protein [Asticcacaulis sp. 201]